MEMTIEVSPLIESRLKRRVARTGQDADTQAGELLRDALADEPSEEELRAEYYRLVGLELQATLSAAEADRLRQIGRELDTHSPAAQAMFQQLQETGRELDEMFSPPARRSARGMFLMTASDFSLKTGVVA